MRILPHEHSVEVADFTTRRGPRCLVRESTCIFDAAALCSWRPTPARWLATCRDGKPAA